MPCRNEAATIIRLLEAIARQSRRPHEIVVVDDQSRDCGPELIAEWASRHPELPVRIISGGGNGTAAAMNLGIAKACGNVIIRLDGHCSPSADYLDRAVTALFEHHAGVVGGVWEIEPGASTVVARAIAAVVSHPIGSGGVSYRNARLAGDRVMKADTVPFGCFRRELWERVGGYDSGLAANEDYDFNYRVRRAGEDVVLDASVRSGYVARATLGALARQYFRYGYWKTQMLKKSPSALRLRQVPPALILPWAAGTATLAVVRQDPALVVLALLYPLLIAGAALHIAGLRREFRLLVPICVSIAVQHASWCAGFWRGLLRAV